jgi:hypothetical protein
MADDDLPLLDSGVHLVIEVTASGLSKTVLASSNETPCFERLAAAFLASQEKDGLIGLFAPRPMRSRFPVL